MGLMDLLDRLGDGIAEGVREQRLGRDYRIKVEGIRRQLEAQDASIEGEKLKNRKSEIELEGYPDFIKQQRQAALDLTRHKANEEKAPTYGPAQPASAFPQDTTDSTGAPLSPDASYKVRYRNGKPDGVERVDSTLDRARTVIVAGSEGQPHVMERSGRGSMKDTGYDAPARGSYAKSVDAQGNETQVPVPPVYRKPGGGASGPAAAPTSSQRPSPVSSRQSMSAGIPVGNRAAANRYQNEQKLSSEEHNHLDQIQTIENTAKAIEEAFRKAGLDPNDNSVPAAANARLRAFVYSHGFSVGVTNPLLQLSAFEPLDILNRYGGVRAAANGDVRRFIQSHIPDASRDTPAAMWQKLQELKKIAQIGRQSIGEAPRSIEDLRGGGAAPSSGGGMNDDEYQRLLDRYTRPRQ